MHPPQLPVWMQLLVPSPHQQDSVGELYNVDSNQTNQMGKEVDHQQGQKQHHTRSHHLEAPHQEHQDPIQHQKSK